MINTESLEKILKKNKDKIPALLEVLNLIGKLCEIDDKKFDNIVNTALDKVENLLKLEAQSKKTCGYTLTASDYRAVGIFKNHTKKHRRKSKKSPKKDKLLKIMPKLYQIKQERHLNYRDLKEYAGRECKMNFSLSYFYEIYKKVNAI